MKPIARARFTAFLRPIAIIVCIHVVSIRADADEASIVVRVVSSREARSLARMLEAELRSVGLHVQGRVASGPRGAERDASTHRRVIDCRVEREYVEVDFRDRSKSKRILVARGPRGETHAAVAATELIRARFLVPEHRAGPSASATEPGLTTEPGAPEASRSATDRIPEPPARPAQAVSMPTTSAIPRIEEAKEQSRTPAFPERASPKRRTEQTTPGEQATPERQDQATSGASDPKPSISKDADPSPTRGRPASRKEGLRIFPKVRASIESGAEVVYSRGPWTPRGSAFVGTTVQFSGKAYLHARGAFDVAGPSETQDEFTVAANMLRVDGDAGAIWRLGAWPLLFQAGAGASAIRVRLSGQTTVDEVRGVNASSWITWVYVRTLLRLELHEHFALFVDSAFGALPSRVEVSFPDTLNVQVLGRFFMRSSLGAEASWAW